MTDVPEPAGVVHLPRWRDDIPIPVHVRQGEQQPVNITAVDPLRLVLITSTRRCTICGWAIRADERCWIVTSPQAVEANRSVDWQRWDNTLEGPSHEECLLYATVACPFLSTPGYSRKTTQRQSDGGVTYDRGTERPHQLLAGYGYCALRWGGVGSEFDLHQWQGEPYTVCVGGGEPLVHDFDADTDKTATLRDAIDRASRVPDQRDTEFAAFMATADQDDLYRLFTQASAEGHGDHGIRINAERNAPCLCRSGEKFKHCCGRRNATAYAGPRSIVLGFPPRFP